MTNLPGFRTSAAPSEAELSQCVHCGLCLNVCPTYRLTGKETESPRGRIHLIQAVGEARLAPTPALLGHLDRCLTCRACETACPSGVHFGQIIEKTRAEMRAQQPLSGLPRLLSDLVFKHLFPYPRRLRAVGLALRFYQQSGLQKTIRRKAILPRFSPALAARERLLPRISSRFYNLPSSGLVRPNPAVAGLPPRQVAFFSGCVMPIFFAETNKATVALLARQNVTVFVPPTQVCCGALQAHTGERAAAQEVARVNIATFSPDGESDMPIIVNAAGCGALLKEYGALLADDPLWAARAARFAARVQDVSEYLALIGLAGTPKPLPYRVTYQDACHLAHAQKVRQQPRALLQQIPGLQLVEMAEADRCCGSAGIYNITQPDSAARVLEEKLVSIEATNPQVVVAGNPGCLLQIESGLRSSGSNVRTKHLVDLLAEAYLDVRP